MSVHFHKFCQSEDLRSYTYADSVTNDKLNVYAFGIKISLKRKQLRMITFYIRIDSQVKQLTIIPADEICFDYQVQESATART